MPSPRGAGQGAYASSAAGDSANERTRSRTWANVRAASILFTLIAALMLGIHVPLLNMPFYWDELGQFIPAALDLYERGALVPVSTLPNIHPPGLMAVLAGLWKITGFSIPATRIAMLLLGSAGVLLAFQLTLRLARGVTGLPGFTTALLLLASPLFYTQAMMAQLDLPAMVLTTLALLLFLEERLLFSVAVCVALVWVKETGAVLPVVFGLFLLREGRRREAALFVLPLLSLLPWLWLLWDRTGSVFGNREFAEYNVLYPLHPARLGLALLRRFWELFLNHGYFLGAIPLVLLWTRRAIFQRREWQLLLWFTTAHILAVTVAGGAALERYLLPVLPILCAAYAIAWCLIGGRWAIALPVTAATLSLLGFFFPPLVPQPDENGIEITRAVGLHQVAAEWLNEMHPERTVATAWPLSDALTRPGLGYSTRKRRVLRLREVTLEEMERIAPMRPEVLVVFTSDPYEDLWLRERFGAVDALRRELYQWQPPPMGRDIGDTLGMFEEARWRSGHSSMAVFVRRDLWNDGRKAPEGNVAVPGGTPGETDRKPQ